MKGFRHFTFIHHVYSLSSSCRQNTSLFLSIRSENWCRPGAHGAWLWLQPWLLSSSLLVDAFSQPAMTVTCGVQPSNWSFILMIFQTHQTVDKCKVIVWYLHEFSCTKSTYDHPPLITMWLSPESWCHDVTEEVSQSCITALHWRSEGGPAITM